LVITHPFHPLRGQCLAVLFTQHKRNGLFFVCEVEGRRRVTVPQEWTDRGVPASAERLAVEGLTAARALVDAIGPRTVRQHADVTHGDGMDGAGPGMGADVGLGASPGGDGGGEHGRVAAARRRGQRR
jgi:hypothetical protein